MVSKGVSEEEKDPAQKDTNPSPEAMSNNTGDIGNSNGKHTPSTEDPTKTANPAPPKINVKWNCIPEIENPMQIQSSEECKEYNVQAKSFIATCSKEMEESVLAAASDLVNDATLPSFFQDVTLEPGPEPPEPNPEYANEWHHRYSVTFQVLANADPKAYLSDFFAKNILQLDEAAVRIAYVETNVKSD